MKHSPLTLDQANAKLQTELIANGRGTQAVHETVVAYRANRRSGTHQVKTKATVKLSGKKPWRQKGTGRARAGYASSPVWRGGGVVFGPHPRDYSKKIPKKVKKLALKKALSARIAAGDVVVFDALALKGPKTHELMAALKGAMGSSRSALLVLPQNDRQVYLASRNHPKVEATTAADVNAEQLLRYDKVLVGEGAFEKLAARLKSETNLRAGDESRAAGSAPHKNRKTADKK